MKAQVFIRSLFLAFSLLIYASDLIAADVWVNAKSKVYHCEGARWYGKTKNGFYLDEVQAIKKGYRAAGNNRCSNAGRQAIKDIPNQEGSQNKVWINTKSKVYHCQGTRYYGKTKRGRFITQGEAISIGGRPSKGQRCN